MEGLMEASVHQELMEAVANYEMPEAARKLLNGRELTLLCGITAAGKDTIAHEITGGGDYEIVISHTTRKPRENHGVMEKDGVDYFFVDEPTMLDMVSEHEFIEAKPVHQQYAYGTSVAEVRNIFERSNTPILVIDVQGMEELITHLPQFRPVFVLPPSFAEWQRRLQERGALGEQLWHDRLASADKEIKTALDNPNFQLIVNRTPELVAQFIRTGHIGRDHEAVNVADHLLHDIKEQLS